MERAKGFNVGVDAHIDPQLHATTLYIEWNKVNNIPPFIWVPVLSRVAGGW